MSILGLMENTADIAQTTPDLSALPSTNTERFGAAWDAAQAPDRYWNAQKARHTKAEKIIDDLHAMTGERLKNPFDAGPTQDEIRANPNWSVVSIRAQRLQVLREKTRAAKDGMEKLGGLPEDYLDVDSIDPSIASEAGALRARDERMTGTGGGAGAFLGGMAGETASPHGILSSFIPVTRLGTAAAQATVRGFALNVAREAAFQAGTQGLAQSFATLIDYQTRKEFGTEQTTAQIFEEILGATVGGGLLGGAFRATHLGILKLASRGVEIPPAVLDSARVMEEGDLYGNKNPLRVAPGQNEVATDQAMGAAVMGRAASPDVLPAGIAQGPADIPAGQRLAATAAEAPPAPGAAPSPADQAASIRSVTPEQYEGLGRVVGVQEVFTPAMPASGRAAGKNAFFIDPQGRIIDVSEIGHPEALARLNDMAGLGRDHEGGFYGGDSPLVRIDATTFEGSTSIGVNAYEGGVTSAQKRMIDQIEREVAISQRKGEDISYQGEVSKDYAGAPAGDLASVKIREEAVDPELQRLVKSIEEHPENPMQAPRMTPEVAPAPAKAKAPGESAEDKTVLKQAQAVIDSETITRIDPEARRKMELVDIEEREYKAAIACVVGVI